MGAEIMCGSDSERDKNKIDIHLHYGGYFRELPTFVYTSDRAAIFKDCDVDCITRGTLLHMYRTVEDAPDVRLFFQAPCCELDVGVILIRDDTEEELLRNSYRGMAQMHIYAENGAEPIIVVSPTGDLVQHKQVGSITNDEEGRDRENSQEDFGGDQLHGEHYFDTRASNAGDTNTNPEWFKDGLESSGDEDTFEEYRFKGPFEGTCGENSSKASKEVREFPENSSKNPIQSYRDGSQSPTESGIVNIGSFEWNEQVEDEKGLLDSVWCDEDGQRVQENSEFNSNVEFAKPEFDLRIGQKFMNVKAFRSALIEWHVRGGYEFCYTKNESSRVTAICKRRLEKKSGASDPPKVVCNWRIHASPIQGSSTFQIKSLEGRHMCGREYSNVHATSNYISQKMHNSFVDNPSIAVSSVVNAVRRVCMIDISAKQAYRAKCKARIAMQGVDMEQYHRIWDYGHTLLNHNPGSRVTLKVHRVGEDDVGTFQRMFFSLGAMSTGFVQGCRPIIGLDGCFLKSPFGGQLLTAMGRDGNDNMFPIALAVVEAETFDSWSWFLGELREHIGEGNRLPWTFISDRQKGLVFAIKKVFPDSDHRFCVRHMYQNFKQRFKGLEFRDLFWAAASAGNMHDFERAMKNLERADPKVGDRPTAVEWLMKVPPELWARSHFSHGCKSDILVNNLNESFNNFILQARDKPIISMFEWIRRRLMKRMHVKKIGMKHYAGSICPNIQGRIEQNKRLSRHCIAVYASPGEYEVDCGSLTHLVNLAGRTCTCGSFQLTGIPCSHSIAAIHMDKRPVEDYVDKCYSKEAYLTTYSETIRGIPSMDYWDTSGNSAVNPPIVRKQPGRPKKMRKREVDEPHHAGTRRGLPVNCKRCFRPGHNSRTCKHPVHPKSKFYKAPTSNGATEPAHNDGIGVERIDGNLV